MEEQQKQAIIELAEKHFCLTEESLKLFKKLVGNDDSAEEFAHIASQPDRRLFIDAGTTFASENNENWKSFKNNFNSFCFYTNLNGTLFLTNRLDNGVKITTAFVKYYLEDIFPESENNVETNYSGKINNLLSMFARFGFPIEYRKQLILGIFKEIFTTKNVDDFEFSHNYYNFSEIMFFEPYERKLCFRLKRKGNQRCSALRKKIEKKDWIKALKKFGVIEKVTTALNTKYLQQNIGKKDNSKKFQFCLSLNYADWLLASTGEEWTSCYNMKDSRGYWRGLASIVNDKNRILLFLTDGTEKEFLGIKSLRMYERCWGFISHLVVKEKEDFLFIMSTYPYGSSIIDFKTLKEAIKMPVFKNNDVKYGEKVAKYPFPVLWHIAKENHNDVKEFTSLLSEDLFYKKFANKEKTMFIYSTSGKNSFTNEFDSCGFDYMPQGEIAL